jgi:hypothetical protein
MHVFDDGSGPRLFIGGSFAVAGSSPALRVATWSPAGWMAPTAGAGGDVLAMETFDSGGVAALYLGGVFTDAGGRPSPRIAAWVACPACYPNCDGSVLPPVLNIGDFVCFLNRFASGDPFANCDQSTAPPVLNVLDFTCFLNRFADGCP